jgi:type I restriction enzyme R subunit
VIREDKARRRDEAEFLKDLLEIRKQEEERGQVAKEKNLDSDEYAFYGMFATYGERLFNEDDKKRRELAKEIVQKIRSRRVVDWTEKEDVKKEMRREIKDLMRKLDFPHEELELFVRELIELAEKRFQ